MTFPVVVCRVPLALSAVMSAICFALPLPPPRRARRACPPLCIRSLLESLHASCPTVVVTIAWLLSLPPTRQRETRLLFESVRI